MKQKTQAIKNWWRRQRHGTKYIVYASVYMGDRYHNIEIVGGARSLTEADTLWIEYCSDRRIGRGENIFKSIKRIPWGMR